MRNILIIGGEHEDRVLYAKSFAQKELCLKPSHERACEQCINCQRTRSDNHPNVIVVEPLGAPQNDASLKEQNGGDAMASIKIDQIRRLIIENNKPNFESGLGIFIITHMHKTTKAAANALLKAIEESHKDKIFIALAPSRTSVVPTIASRLICHPIKPRSSHAPTDSARIRNEIMDISHTPPKERFALCARFGTDRDELVNYIDELSLACHSMLHSNEVSPRLALRIKEALLNAEIHLKQNLNARLVIENLLFREWPLVCR